MSETNWPLLLGVMTVVFGGVAILGTIQIATLRRYRTRGRFTRGVVSNVIRYESGSPGHREYWYTVRVKYYAADREYEIAVPVDTNPAFYTEGKNVPVYYFPDRPEKGRVVCLREYVKWLMMVVVSLSVVVGLFAIWFRQT